MKKNGKKYCRLIFIILRGKKEPKGRGAANTKVLMKSALIIVPLAVIHYLKEIPNLKVAAAGPVFMNPSAKAVSFILQIIITALKKLKCNAAAGKHLLGIYLI